jgi:hypothetical protein
MNTQPKYVITLHLTVHLSILRLIISQYNFKIKETVLDKCNGTTSRFILWSYV